MDKRLTASECRRLMGDAGNDVGDEEILAVRDGAYKLANVLADAHADLQSRFRELELAQLDPSDAWRVAALGLSSEDLAQIEEELDAEASAQIDEVLRDHEGD